MNKSESIVDKIMVILIKPGSETNSRELYILNTTRFKTILQCENVLKYPSSAQVLQLENGKRINYKLYVSDEKVQNAQLNLCASLVENPWGTIGRKLIYGDCLMVPSDTTVFKNGDWKQICNALWYCNKLVTINRTLNEISK